MPELHDISAKDRRHRERRIWRRGLLLSAVLHLVVFVGWRGNVIPASPFAEAGQDAGALHAHGDADGAPIVDEGGREDSAAPWFCPLAPGELDRAPRLVVQVGAAPVDHGHGEMGRHRALQGQKASLLVGRGAEDLGHQGPCPRGLPRPRPAGLLRW